MADDHHDVAQDPRHQKRVSLMQQLFSSSFYDSLDLNNLDESLLDIQPILLEVKEIDQRIKTAAPKRPLSDINKVDLAIIRLIVFESRQTKTPKKVLINEGIELAKEFGTESSPRFVNAVLGKLLVPERAKPTTT